MDVIKKTQGLYTFTVFTRYTRYLKTGGYAMPNLTITIPEELKKDMERLPELNWSETVPEFLTDKVKRALLLNNLDEPLEK